VPPVRGRIGRPRRRPRTLLADRGYDHDKYRRHVWERGVKPMIARRGTEHGTGLGRHRWVVERTFAWLHSSAPIVAATSAKTSSLWPAVLICWRKLELAQPDV
jgi:transposase